MNDFQTYLLDEFVEDYRAGRMSRRDFVRKSIGVAGGLAAAMSLFSALGLSEAEVAAAQVAPRAAQADVNPITVSPDDPDIMTADVSFPTADGSTLQGYMAMPSAEGTSAGVVVIHENRGLLAHHMDVVRRYAKAGFAAVAPDLVSREGGTPNVDPDAVPGMLATADPQRHADDASAAGAFIRTQNGVRPDASGLTGFCFGGGVVWRTISADPAIAAAVPFYGPPPPLEGLQSTQAAVFAVYAELDTGITSSAPAVMAALETAGVPHTYKVYPGANHAFFNDTGPRYDPMAAADAWARAVDWFQRFLT